VLLVGLDTIQTNYLHQGGYVFVVVCLSITNNAQKLPSGFAGNFQVRLATLANEQMIKFQWRSGSPSGYRDCFLYSSLPGDMESSYWT